MSQDLRTDDMPIEIVQSLEELDQQEAEMVAESPACVG
jgi:hypothetical protein